VVSDFVQIRWLASFLLAVFLAAPDAAKTTFLIFPPENLTKNKTLSWIGDGLAIAISEECQVPGVETISWEERVRFVEASDLPPSAVLSRASMIRVAQRAAADRLVFGSYRGNEANLRIDLRVLDLKSMKLSGPIVANGSASALAQLENELAWVILSDGGRNGAISRESFRARTRSVPNRAFAYFITCLGITDEDERARLLLKTLEMYRDIPQASFFLGAYYFQNGDCSKAVQHLKPALREAQYFLEAQFMLGTCYLRLDNVAEALAPYNAILDQDKPLEVFNNLGIAYMRRGDFALAVQNLIEARNLARTDMTVGMNLAILRSLQGDETAALAVLEELVAAHPEQGILQFLFGLSLSRQGENAKSAAALERAGRLGIDVEKMKHQDPRTWARLFPTWNRRPQTPWIGETKRQETGPEWQRH
jgi:Tfp pilus assembly protein PilF